MLSFFFYSKKKLNNKKKVSHSATNKCKINPFFFTSFQHFSIPKDTKRESNKKKREKKEPSKKSERKKIIFPKRCRFFFLEKSLTSVSGSISMLEVSKAENSGTKLSRRSRSSSCNLKEIPRTGPREIRFIK